MYSRISVAVRLVTPVLSAIEVAICDFVRGFAIFYLFVGSCKSCDLGVLKTFISTAQEKKREFPRKFEGQVHLRQYLPPFSGFQRWTRRLFLLFFLFIFVFEGRAKEPMMLEPLDEFIRVNDRV